MNINWTVRIKNPIWWAQIAAAIVMPLIVGMGYEWQDMTSWGTLLGTLCAAVQNPVVLMSMLATLWAAITDPTTKGMGDSAQAMAYDKPKED